MRNFVVSPLGLVESDTLPQVLPPQGFLWLSFSRREFEVMQHEVQSLLLALSNVQLYELHISDLLNNQLPSHFDFTSDYDLVVFRRLARGKTESDISQPGKRATHSAAHRHQPSGFCGLGPHRGFGTPRRLRGTRRVRGQTAEHRAAEPGTGKPQASSQPGRSDAAHA